MKTISGKLVGKDGDIVVRYDEVRECVVNTVHLKGRWLYVKKCKWAEEFNGVIITEKSRKDIPVAIVLGMGTGCGKYHKLTKEQKRMGMTEQVEWPEEVIGKKVLSPDNHEWGILNSPWSEDEFMLHECIVKSILEEEKGDDK